ncbi:nucleolar and coiled-body phosphoprotein 1-like isoform X2 [Daphnia pulicaria]|uniref:nucleolar and coiled-body phosphoprotein 1-like isoform X2 n=1 Tax=Daphnia pulicaria TaxID=35523 RepID=UPI001EEC922B|nr:nucleolar and coiled-body phosphoprotein 1-like isoform X2 [Daphnia pulicaria]
MKIEELNSMSYREIEKLAKEKLNITRRGRVSKEILIEQLLQHHQNLLADSHFISTDETTDDSTMESEVVQEPTIPRRGRKRGNQKSNEQQKALPVSKKAKKECVEHTLNSTFSVDEDSDDAKKKDLPSIEKPKKAIPKNLRGRKKVYLTEESSTNESENEKVPAKQVKKIKSVEAKEQSVTQESEPENEAVEGKVQILDNAIEKSPENQSVAAKVPKRKLKKSASAGEQHVTANVAEKIPARRTRSSDKVVEPDQSVKAVITPKSTPTVAVPSLPEPASPPVVLVAKKTLLLRTSSHPVRSRKPSANLNTPAKMAVTPAASAKKGVQFTAASTDNSSNIPKMAKRKAAPNFAEIHQKHFLKMQSVDEYVDKKRARTDTMNASAKAVRTKSVLNNAQTKPSTPQVKTDAPITTESIATPTAKPDMKFNFVSGLQKPVFTAKGQVVNGKQRVMATVKENLQNNNASQIPAVMTKTAASIGGKRKASMLNASRDVNTSTLSMAGKQILRIANATS